MNKQELKAFQSCAKYIVSDKKIVTDFLIRTGILGDDCKLSENYGGEE